MRKVVVSVYTTLDGVMEAPEKWSGQRGVFIVTVSRVLCYQKHKGAVLDELTQKTFLAYKNRAAALHRFMNESDHFLSLGLHQGNPGRRGSGVWIVLGTPVRHFHQDRDEIEIFFRQDILLFSLILLREFFHQKALMLQLSEAVGENIGRHPFF